MTIDFSKYFYYDESSPTCLRWKVARFSGKDHKIMKVQANDIAGCINKSGYYRVSLYYKNYGCHRIIYELTHGINLSSSQHIDHMDRNRKNNVKTNLRLVTKEINCRNVSMSRRNTSGVTGVSFISDGHGGYYVAARWRDDKRSRIKSFSILRYGLLPAYRMAILYRQQKIREMNEKGAGYTETHGMK